MSVGCRLFQYLDTVCISQSHEIILQNALQPFQQGFVDHRIEEIKIVLAVVQGPSHTIFDKVFLEIHQLGQVDESNLWLNHPELGQVTWCVRVLGTERRPEGINLPQSRGSQLTFQLSAHRETGHLAKEIIFVAHLSIFPLFQIIEVLRGHLKHLASAFSV